jgi:TPR repeat protein
MISSTLPLVEHPDWHPVHRATAMLRQALLTSASSRPDAAEIWGDRLYPFDPAPIELVNGPVSVVQPASLPALLGLLPGDNDAEACQSLVTYGDDVSAPNASVTDSSGEDEMLDRTELLQLHGLVQAFYRRQRQASLLVAASIATAVALTFGGLILLFSMTGPGADKREDAAPKDGTSVARAARRAEIEAPFFQPIPVRASRPAAPAALLIRAKAEIPASDQSALDTSVVHATAKRPLALGPLLPLGSARYLMLRGLPEEAQLSAGRRTGTGTWMVKAADMADLTLTLGDGAGGDYPLDVYLLDTSNGPQARRRLVLRVDPAPQAPQAYAAGFGLTWPAPQTPPPATETGTAPALPADADVLHERAQVLLGEGKLAAARRLLTSLAEEGHAEAAYELALTYDREVLDHAGIHGVDADPAIATAWYEYAAREGHAGAAQRLKVLARRRGDA